MWISHKFVSQGARSTSHFVKIAGKRKLVLSLKTQQNAGAKANSCVFRKSGLTVTVASVEQDGHYTLQKQGTVAWYGRALS